MAKKPNIILLFPDQHRGDTMGCVGHPVIITPNLDRLAAEGVVFRRCSTNSPLCVPARSTLVTGQYVNQHGAWDNSAPADRYGPSHVRNIRNAGYHTALIGKTHLLSRSRGRHAKDYEYQLHDWGYEDTMELGSTVNAGGFENAWTDHLAEKGLLETYRESIREFNRINWSFQRRPWEDPPAPIPAEDHIDNFCGRKAVEWIRDYKGKKPFYLQVCFPGPHPPFNSAPDYRALYNPDDIPVGILETPGEPIPPYVDFVMRWSGQLADMTPAQNQLMRTFYYAKVTMIDERIGDILNVLEKRGMLDNTWIIYTSDHGENLGDHRLNQKVVFYESALNVPFIIRPPGGIKGWQCSGLTDHLDLVATILEIAGANLLPDRHGRSLISQVMAGPDSADAQKGKEVIFSEVAGYTMARSERYKLAIDAKTRQPVELLDLVDDPRELRNLVNNPSLEKVRSELYTQYLVPLLEKADEVKFRAWEKIAQARTLPGLSRQ
jgi:choline-sulfatase